MTVERMSLAAATARLALVLRAENAALADGDAEAAALLLPEKLAAVEAVRTATPDPRPTAAETSTLRDLLDENSSRLALAIDVQSRILELVARAARQAAPGPMLYGRRAACAGRDAMALALKA